MQITRSVLRKADLKMPVWIAYYCTLIVWTCAMVLLASNSKQTIGFISVFLGKVSVSVLGG